MRERRLSARINARYPVRFKGVASDGQKFKEDTVLDNLSGGGLYLYLTRPISVGTDASIAVRLSTASADSPSLHLAVRGKVLRVEPQPDRRYGVAVEFTRRRVL